MADEEPETKSLELMNIGRNQKFHENGEDWSCENYKDEQKGNISFRIRLKYDDSGKLKEAYYGKIYGGD